MANPYLPSWEYIPDGEPRVFGDRVYVYGSHDCPESTQYCDYKLRVWSAPLNDLSHWVCHGDVFHTKPDMEHFSSVDWTDNPLYAPDVIEKDGKYYLYFYILCADGGVAVSDSPTGPFELLSRYKRPENTGEEFCEYGIFVDPGVLVDEGKVYIYCGFTRSYMVQLNPENMYEVLEGTYIDNIIPVEEPFRFYEACSPRRVKDTYYLIYSPLNGSCLDYATSDSPTGPFDYRGTIVDNSLEYPGGNDHGSICNINGQWYIFYHRMTNNTDKSRRGCVEKIQILQDGTIPQVEMTSLGFEEALSPYEKNDAERACVLIGGNYITEQFPWSHPIIENCHQCVVGYKYFEFGEKNTTRSLTLNFLVRIYQTGIINIYIDHYKDGLQIGMINLKEEQISEEFTWVTTEVLCVEGRHSLYFVFESEAKSGNIADLEQFIFTMKNVRGE